MKNKNEKEKERKIVEEEDLFKQKKILYTIKKIINAVFAE